MFRERERPHQTHLNIFVLKKKGRIYIYICIPPPSLPACLPVAPERIFYRGPPASFIGPGLFAWRGLSIVRKRGGLLPAACLSMSFPYFSSLTAILPHSCFLPVGHTFSHKVCAHTHTHVCGFFFQVDAERFETLKRGIAVKAGVWWTDSCDRLDGQLVSTAFIWQCHSVRER